MAADEGTAMRYGKERLTFGLLARVDWQRPADLAFVLDLIDQARPNLVAIPRKAEQRLVEMGMGLHKTRQRNTSTSIKDGHTGRRRSLRDTPGQDQDIRKIAAQRSDASDKQIIRQRLSPIP